jgi:succinoglycan biosynthesis protein ExoA
MPDRTQPYPTVSVIIPCRNERGTIVQCLDSILAGDYPADRLEILVADGASDDGTREILDAYCALRTIVRIIHNPKQTVSPGLNLAIKASASDIIVRMDAHTEYAPDYIRQCILVLEKTNADNAGGPWRTKASGFLPEAIALAFHSPFSAGGALSRDLAYEGPVDTVIYGCWRREKLLEFGLFDEELARNQDDELNLRITRAGGAIWQSPRIRSWYQPRSSLPALLRQYSQYGYWKVRVIQKHGSPASWRHLIPGSFVASLLGLGLAAPFCWVARALFLLEAGLYIAANLAATLVTCRGRKNIRYLPLTPLIFAVYHFGYGYGFLRGLIDFVLLKRGASRDFLRLTRTNGIKQKEKRAKELSTDEHR